MHGNPQENEGATARPFDFDFILDISRGKINPDIRELKFRDANTFVAGRLHDHIECWEKIVDLAPYDEAFEVLEWIRNKVSLHTYFRQFKGSFQDCHYDSPSRRHEGSRTTHLAANLKNLLIRRSYKE